MTVFVLPVEHKDDTDQIKCCTTIAVEWVRWDVKGRYGRLWSVGLSQDDVHAQLKSRKKWRG